MHGWRQLLGPGLVACLAGGGACRVAGIDLHDRPCSAGGACVEGFTCDFAVDRCVGAGDPCQDEGRLLECRFGDTACALGCRVCSTGQWSACGPPPPPSAPILSGVGDLCAGAPAQVSWAPIPGLSYAAELLRDGSWVAADEVTASRATVAALPAGADYRWRVRAFHQALTGDWVESVVFAVRPLPTNPALEGVGDLCPGAAASVTYTAQPGATHTVELWDLSAWRPPTGETPAGATVSDLPLGEGYRWRIRTALDGCASDWSESTTFALRPLPELLRLSTVTMDLPPRMNSQWEWRPDRCPVREVRVRRAATAPSTLAEGVDAATVSSTHFADQDLSLGELSYYGVFVARAGLPGHVRQAVVAVVPDRTSVNALPLPEPGGGGPSFTLDGDDDDPGWLGTATIPFSFAQTRNESGGLDPAVSGYVRVARDSATLYLFFAIDDAYVHADPLSGEEWPWTNDALEIFFDVDFDRDDDQTPDPDDHQLIITADGQTRFGRGDGAASSYPAWTPSPAVAYQMLVRGTLNVETDLDEGWQLELFVPLATLGIAELDEPRTIGFSFTIDEDDLNDHATQHAYPWNVGAVYNRTSTWGTCQL